MCRMLYLGTARPLPTIQKDARYPELTIASIVDAALIDEIDQISPHTAFLPSLRLEQIHRLMPHAKVVYEVCPTDLCGCYFEFPPRSDLEQELHDTVPTHNSVSSITYPHLDPREAAQQWWERRYTAVTSFGRYLTDNLQDGMVTLYVVWEGEEGSPIVEQQTLTPAFFTDASSLTLPSNSLFTIVPSSEV